MKPTMNQWKKSILDRLAFGDVDRDTPGFGEKSVYREGLADEDQLPRFENGIVKPYVSVWFGQRVAGNMGFQGITGVRQNAHMMYFMAVVNATDGYMVDQAVDLTSDLLLGFRPMGQGELSEDGMKTIRRPADMSGVRSRFSVSVGYSGAVDI